MYNITISKNESNHNFTTTISGAKAAWEAFNAAVAFAEMLTDTYVELLDAETSEIIAVYIGEEE